MEVHVIPILHLLRCTSVAVVDKVYFCSVLLDMKMW